MGDLQKCPVLLASHPVECMNLAYIRELEAVQSWIPVSERLPEDARPVIVAGGCGHYSHKYKKWYTNMERDRHGEYLPIQWEVTHWMPLPPAPQEEG